MLKVDMFDEKAASDITVEEAEVANSTKDTASVDTVDPTGDVVATEVNLLHELLNCGKDIHLSICPSCVF